MKLASIRKWTRIVAGLALVVGVVLAARGGGAAGRRCSDWPVGLAHRGDSSSAPENTLQAFALGLEGGAGGLEMDVHLSRDGGLFVIHDPTVDRTTNGTGRISALTSDEIRALDAGYRFSPDGETFPYRGRGVGIPTLREVYETFPEAFVNVDMKSERPGIEARLLKEIMVCKAADRTLVASESHGRLARFRQLALGRVQTSASRWEILVFFLAVRLGLWRSLRPDYTALQVPAKVGRVEVVTPEFVEAARSLGVKVDVWTINDTDEMRRLLALGVDAIMTDRPSALAEVDRLSGAQSTQRKDDWP